jgi:hypothetical protein
MRRLYQFSRLRIMSRLKKIACCTLLAVLLLSKGMAQTIYFDGSIEFDGTPYTQNFQSISATILNPVPLTNATMLRIANQPGAGPGVEGWFVYNQQGGPLGWGRTNGTLSTGAFYSLFDNAGNTALGSQGADNSIAYWGVAFINTSGATINQISISYDAVIGRNPSTTVNGYPMSYRIGTGDLADGYPYTGEGTFNDAAGTWTAGIGFTTPSSGAGAPGPQAAISPLLKIGGTITQTLTNLNWGNGQYLYIRWKDTDESGNDATAGIDNFSLSKVQCSPPSITAPPPITVALNSRSGNAAGGFNLGTPVITGDCGIASIDVYPPYFDNLGTTRVAWTVTDSSGNVAIDSQDVTVIDTLKPAMYLQQSKLLNGITGNNSSQSPYLKPARPGVQFTSILTAGDAVSGYKMTGAPSGLDAYDNNDGTFTLLVNHEISSTLGVTRAHGSNGSFISKWIINKSDLSVVSGSDLMQQVYLWDTTTQTYNQDTYAFSNFRAGYLGDPSSFYNSATGKGTTERIYITGEDNGLEGKAMAHILTGPNAGKSYELPALGKFAWKQLTVLSLTNDQTIVLAADGGTEGEANGHIYYYYGTKTKSGTEIERAGLTNGILYAANAAFTKEDTADVFLKDEVIFARERLYLGDVKNKTGAELYAQSLNGGATLFANPGGIADIGGDYYFTTCAGFNKPARLWQFTTYRQDYFSTRVNGYTPPDYSGQLAEQKLWQNLAYDFRNHFTLLEDPGNNAHIAKLWQYGPSLYPIAYFDSARFLPGAANFITQNEGAAGIMNIAHILGPGMYLTTAQVRSASSDPAVVEGGQLLAYFNPYSLNAGDAKDTIKVTLPTGSTSATVNLGSPFTADNVGVTGITNDAPATFPAGTTYVTWTATDKSGNSSSIIQTVVVTGNTGCNATPKGTSADRGFIANVSGRKNVSTPNGFNNTTCFTGYGDYTSQTVTAEPGRLLVFNITPGYTSSEHPGLYITAYIDWNGDGDFLDAEEIVFAPRNPTNVKTRFTKRVPAGTTAGNKRIRMIVRSDKHSGPCDVFTYGEVEDYSVIITGTSARIKGAGDELDDAGDDFTVYPNPVKDRMVIERSGYDEMKTRQAPADMVLTDINGKVIMRSKLTSLIQEVKVSNLAAGIYFVTIINQQSKTTHKIVINH